MLLTTDRYFSLPSRTEGAQTLDLSAAMISIDADAARLCAGLSDEQLAWRPHPERWSIAQNLAHLRATTDVFLPTVDAAIATSRSRALHSEGPFHLRVYGRLLVSQMESKRMFRLRAPRRLRPQLLPSPSLELDGFLTAHAAMRERVRAAEGLDLTGLRFRSPITCCVRVNLLEFFSAFNAHSRRHMRQAQHVRQVLSSSH